MRAFLCPCQANAVWPQQAIGKRLSNTCLHTAENKPKVPQWPLAYPAHTRTRQDKSADSCLGFQGRGGSWSRIADDKAHRICCLRRCACNRQSSMPND